jgi:hypothetical protein
LWAHGWRVRSSTEVIVVSFPGCVQTGLSTTWILDRPVWYGQTVCPKESRDARVGAGALLAAADELFNAEGHLHTVGIDRRHRARGVAKASLYSTFGSKDELVRAYLMRRHERRQARIMASVAKYDDPQSKVLGIFDYLGDLYRDPRFRGCPFVNANAEGQPGGRPRRSRAFPGHGYGLLVLGLVTEIGVTDPEGLAHQLILLL